jgi:hypothetical protein
MFLKLKSKIDSLNVVGLKDLDSVSLLNRVDSKYVVTLSQLDFIFQCLQSNYSILEIDGIRVFSYENNYFDTPNLLFYKDHHNGYANRLKVRSRKYVEANLSFFEIKKKENIDRTNKYREKTPEILTSLNDVRKQKIQDFTRKEIDEINLILKNNFKRITLVNKGYSERVTIDTNLTFIDENQEINFGEIAIIEVKQSKSSQKSELTSFLKKHNIREQSISKYIYGILLLMPTIKKNKFIPIIKKINKLNN